MPSTPSLLAAIFCCHALVRHPPNALPLASLLAGLGMQPPLIGFACLAPSSCGFSHYTLLKRWKLIAQSLALLLSRLKQIPAHARPPTRR
ncbi:MAG: hypothetical protein R3E58_16725 [Phycisphaerae bacterium]